MPSPFSKILVKCQQATVSDFPFYDIFDPQKVPLLKISDNVIVYDLWLGPLNLIKNPGYDYEEKSMAKVADPLCKNKKIAILLCFARIRKSLSSFNIRIRNSNSKPNQNSYPSANLNVNPNSKSSPKDNLKSKNE